MTPRSLKMFTWSGADFGDLHIPAYRHHPQQRAAKAFRKIIARRARKAEARAVAREIAEGEEMGLDSRYDDGLYADDRWVWDETIPGFRVGDRGDELSGG